MGVKRKFWFCSLAVVSICASLFCFFLFNQNTGTKNIELDSREDNKPILEEIPKEKNKNKGNSDNVVDFNYRGSSVFPYFNCSKKDEKRYFILGREAGGKDAGKWDDWGGGRDKGESRPSQTASREFKEETMGLLNRYGSEEYLNKQEVAINKKKHSISYIIPISEQDALSFLKTFHSRRDSLQKEYSLAPYKSSILKMLEKDSVGIISQEALAKAIKEAKEGNDGRLISPINAKIEVVGRGGKTKTTTIELRPFFVAKMKVYFEEHHIEGA